MKLRSIFIGLMMLLTLFSGLIAGVELSNEPMFFDGSNFPKDIFEPKDFPWINFSIFSNHDLVNDIHQYSVNKNPSIITNYTWAVMRYDFRSSSENHGSVGLPTPSAGTILIPANMMSKEVCRAALTVSKDSKMQTLEAYDVYDSERMIHTQSAFFSDRDEWNTENCYNFRKESAIEMQALGNICLKADLVGECYAQASFNTAVLRLCGFSPEEVFTVGIQCSQGGHAINVIDVDGEWYVFDSTYAPYVRNGNIESLIFETYFRPPYSDHIVFLENDKYMINFGTFYPQYIPTMKDPYLNMDAEKLSEILGHIRPLFNNSFLGSKKWDLDSFVENATPNPWMKPVQVPCTVADAQGNSIDEKVVDLSERCEAFIKSQCGQHLQNQYDKCCYAVGLLSVDYPQVYANAAKLAPWTGLYAIERDKQMPFLDVFLTSFLMHATILNKHVVPDDCVAYSDLLYLRHSGSSIDKAVLAYGTLRNMKKESDFWAADDLFVLITEDNQGYLAVNLNDNWKYLSFEGGQFISETAPANIEMVFNEIEFDNSWGR